MSLEAAVDVICTRIARLPYLQGEGDKTLAKSKASISRRLYDISHVLETIGLLERKSFSGKLHWVWVGPPLEDVHWSAGDEAAAEDGLDDRTLRRQKKQKRVAAAISAMSEAAQVLGGLAAITGTGSSSGVA